MAWVTHAGQTGQRGTSPLGEMECRANVLPWHGLPTLALIILPPIPNSMQIRDNEDKLGDNIQVSLLSDLPMQTSHVLVMDRVDENVDENNALMSSVTT